MTDAILNDLLRENGNLQQRLISLHAEKDAMKVDLETARAREESLRSRETTTNPHALFLLGRPVRRSSIPYLWALSILLIGVVVYVYYVNGVRANLFAPMGMGMTQMGYSTAPSFFSGITNFLGTRSFLYAIIMGCILTIGVIGLRMNNVF